MVHNTQNPPGDCWPTEEQTLLLQAALLDGDAARQAFFRWRSRIDIERLDYGSRRLLPLLHQRLAAADDDPLVPRLREAYERATERNSALIESAAAAIQTLNAAGIDTVVLKGMALIARGLVDPGARPMMDFDLLVAERQALAARDVLVANGWRLEKQMDARILPVRHAAPFSGPSESRLDLHWHVLAECCETGTDADFLHAAEPAMLNGAATRTLCAADFLLHTCVHGVRWSRVPPMRWAVDAVTMIRASDRSIDWERLAVQAESRMLVLPMIDTLRYLRDALAAPVPEWIVDRLSRVSVPSWAREEYRVKRQPRTPRRQLAFHWFQHRRVRRSGTLLGDLVSFPFYMRRRWRYGPV